MEIEHLGSPQPRCLVPPVEPRRTSFAPDASQGLVLQEFLAHKKPPPGTQSRPTSGTLCLVPRLEPRRTALAPAAFEASGSG